MEPIFECEFVPTVPMLANRIRRIRPINVILMLVLGFVCALVTIPRAVEYRFDGLWLPLFLFGCAYFMFSIFWPEINAWRTVRQYQKNYMVSGPYRYTFGDHIVCYQKKMQVSVDYSAITKVVPTQYAYELFMYSNWVIVVEPDRFTKGTFDEFVQFLRAKRPDLQIPE